MLRKSILVVLVATALLGAVVLFNTLRFTAPPDAPVTATAPPTLPDSAVTHLQQAIRFPTVSSSQALPPDTAAFRGFQRFLRRAYPLVHASLQRETVNHHSLLYRWPGVDVSCPPILLLAHYDVVPVEAGTRWRFAPFSGQLREQQIWGRGAIDNKSNVIAQLEAVEQLLRAGKQPARTVYFFFGHDEELGGHQGAKAAARLLLQRGIHPAFILDEGGFVTTQKVPGMHGKPVALIGTAEKGYLSLQLSAAVAGGHSSIPVATTALDLVAQAMVTLRGKEFPAQLTPPMQEFARHVGPRLPFVQRMVFANQWLFRPLILRTYTKTAAGAAAVRTTLVPTIFQAGVKDNVVPTAATATVNLRLLPGTSTASALAQVRAWLPDARVHVKPVGTPAEPSPAASTSNPAYQLIEAQVHQQIPSATVTPFLFVAQSDSRHFLPLSPHIYRFSPFTDPIGFHGVDEHISLKSYQHSIAFYAGLLGGLSAE